MSEWTDAKPVDPVEEEQRWQAQRDAVAWRREYLGWSPMTPQEEVLAEAHRRFLGDAEFRARCVMAADIAWAAGRQYGRWLDTDQAVAAIALALVDRDPITLKARDR